MGSLREHVVSKYDPNVSGRADIIERWDRVAKERGIAAAQWIRFLRQIGVKAAHPDDGWVNRDNNSVFFCYPQFNDKPKAGDLICLGSHYEKDNRIVRVTDRKKSIISRSVTYYFEELARGPS